MRGTVIFTEGSSEFLFMITLINKLQVKGKKSRIPRTLSIDPFSGFILEDQTNYPPEHNV